MTRAMQPKSDSDGARDSDAGVEALAARFDAARPMLRALAYRMLGVGAEAEDAVQDAWLRLRRVDAGALDNFEGWLTTAVARVCLDRLRARRRAARREEAFGISERDAAPRDAGDAKAATEPAARTDPEHDAQMADSVGLALLVVLDRLQPAERVALVLHDVFDISFEEIASIVGRSPAATRQLASRARRRVRATPLREAAALRGAALEEQRAIVEAYVAASRAGDLAGLVALLDPNVMLHLDPADVARGAPAELRGVHVVAGKALAYGARAAFAEPALIDGAMGVIVAPRGRLVSALRLTIADGRIVAIDVVTDPARLAQLEIAVPDR